MNLKEKPKKIYIGFRGTQEEKNEVEIKAKKKGLTVSDYLRFLINKDKED